MPVRVKANVADFNDGSGMRRSGLRRVIRSDFAYRLRLSLDFSYRMCAARPRFTTLGLFSRGSSHPPFSCDRTR